MVVCTPDYGHLADQAIRRCAAVPPLPDVVYMSWSFNQPGSLLNSAYRNLIFVRKVLVLIILVNKSIYLSLFF